MQIQHMIKAVQLSLHNHQLPNPFPHMNTSGYARLLYMHYVHMYVCMYVHAYNVSLPFQAMYI